MPYSAELIDRGTGIRLTGQGLLTGQELIQSGESRFDLLHSAPKLTHYLVDFTQVTSLAVTIDEIFRAGEIDRQAAKTHPMLFIAIVAPSSLIDYLAKVYTELSSPAGWKIQVFNTIESARAWLASVLPADLQ